MIKVKSICSVQWGIRYFEVAFENTDGKYVGSIDIPLGLLKKKEVTMTLRGTKKLTAWLETSEGQSFIEDKLEESA